MAGPASAQPGFGRQFYIFLFSTDLVVLFIYLLFVPADHWEKQATSLRSIGSLVASILAYLGLDKVLRSYLTNVAAAFDELWIRGVLWFITLILWSAVLPIWPCRLEFQPAQTMPPRIKVAGWYRNLVRSGDNAYVLEGLLLRSYFFEIEGARDAVYLPMASILKGTFLHRPLPVQLPCLLTISPVVPGASVFVRRVGAESEQELAGSLPDDGKVFLMPGRYDYIRVLRRRDNKQSSSAFEMKCPTANLQMPW